MSKTETVLGQLADRVRRVRRRRGVGLPDMEAVVRFLVGCFEPEEAREIGRQVDAQGGSYEPIAQAVEGMDVGPAAEPLRGAVCEALAAVAGQDAKGYKLALADVERALDAYSAACPGWAARANSRNGFAPSYSPAVAEAGEKVTALDLAGVALWEAAEELRSPAPVAVQRVDSAPAVAAIPGGEVGEKIAKACEMVVDEEVEEVEVRLVRRPGDGPVVVPGAPLSVLDLDWGSDWRELWRG